jgi:hypothetical protein
VLGCDSFLLVVVGAVVVGGGVGAVVRAGTLMSLSSCSLCSLCWSRLRRR